MALSTYTVDHLQASAGLQVMRLGVGAGVFFLAGYLVLGFLSGVFLEYAPERLYWWLPIGWWMGWRLLVGARQVRMLTLLVAVASVGFAWVWSQKAGLLNAGLFLADWLAVSQGSRWVRAWEKRGGGREITPLRRHLQALAVFVLVALIPGMVGGGLLAATADVELPIWVLISAFYMQSLLGLILVAPTVVFVYEAWLRRKSEVEQQVRVGRLIEAGVLLFLMSLWVLELGPGLYEGQPLPTRYHVMPFVFWAVWRLGAAGTALTVLAGAMLDAISPGVHAAEVPSLLAHGREFTDVGLLAVLGQCLALVVDWQRFLRARADRLAHIAERTGASVVLADPAGRVTWVNAAFSRATGYTLEEVRDKTLGVLLCGSETDWGARRRMSEAVREGHPFCELVRNDRKDGSAFWNQVNVDPWRDEGGRLAGFIAVQIDVTEVLEARAAREREARWREFIAAAPVALALLDGQGRVLARSRRWQREVEVADVREGESGVLPAYLPGDLQRAVVEGVRDGRGRRGERAEMEHPQAGRCFLRWETQVLKEFGQAGAGLVVLVENVTDQVRAEQRLRTETERLRMVTRATRDLVWDWDLVTNTQWWNEAYHDFWGSKDYDYRPTFAEWLERVHPEDRPRVIRSYEVFAAGREVHYDQELRLRRADGVYVSFLDRCYGLRDESGKLVRMIGALQDISAQVERSEQRLAQARLESTGTLAAGIAHDFNNLLAIISLGMEIRKNPWMSEVARARAGESMEDALKAARALANRLLALAEGGAAAPEVADIEALLRSAVERALSGSLVEAEFDIELGLPLVRGEVKQLGQLFCNLAQNAREAVERAGLRSGVLRVVAQAERVEGAAPQIRILFHDDGPGVPDEIAARIFDPYFSTKPRGAEKGLGLGLTLCQAIARKHGGTLRLARGAAGSGGGATFELRLPAMSEPVGLNSWVGIGSVRRVGEEKVRSVMLVEDESDLRESLTRMLEAKGRRVLACGDGMEALAALEKTLSNGGPPDLALIDLTLPGCLDGIATFDALRKRAPGLRAVIMSGYSSAPAILEPERAGFVGALAKPFSFNDLEYFLT